MPRSDGYIGKSRGYMPRSGGYITTKLLHDLKFRFIDAFYREKAGIEKTS